MIIAARVILGMGVGLEGGTVPVYVAESVERRIRGNLVSLYQFNIALGEVLGYAVAAMFVRVEGNWRYILGSSLVFSTIMFLGVLFFFFSGLATGTVFAPTRLVTEMGTRTTGGRAVHAANSSSFFTAVSDFA